MKTTLRELQKDLLELKEKHNLEKPSNSITKDDMYHFLCFLDDKKCNEDLNDAVLVIKKSLKNIITKSLQDEILDKLGNGVREERKHIAD